MRERTVYDSERHRKVTMTETITAEKALKARQRASATAGAQRSIDDSAFRDATKEHFSTAVEAAASRLVETGYPGGEIRKRWMGRDITEDVAVWYLETDLLGTYWFSPTLKAVLWSPLRLGEDARRHKATSTEPDPHRHHAIAQLWLLRMDPVPYTSDLQALTHALVRLYAR